MDKAAGQDAGAHLVSPCEWAFIMMPPGLTIGFILSLLLVATMLPEEVKVTQEEGQRERERERGGGAASPQTYITTRGILSLSPTLAILSPPRCSFVDFSSDREKRKIVGR